MKRKLLMAVALASAFGLSNFAAYADDEKKETEKPELIAEDDKKEVPKPELIADSHEKETSKPEFIA
ncbi:MAG: hypothetical protein ACREUB_12700 [Burkholderiales bacterium]